MATFDLQVRWTIPNGKPWDGRFVNEAERGFAQFLDLHGIEWEYEPWFFYQENPESPAIYAPRGYCPDFYLPRYHLFVEIHGADKWDNKQRALGKKRRRIRWLAHHTGIPVVLLHYNNWPGDWTDFIRLMRRAEIAAAIEHYAEKLLPDEPADESLTEVA